MLLSKVEIGFRVGGAHDGLRREVKYGVDLVLGQHPLQHFADRGRRRAPP